jgi:hypothetical protein
MAAKVMARIEKGGVISQIGFSHRTRELAVATTGQKAIVSRCSKRNKYSTAKYYSGLHNHSQTILH